MTLLQSQVSLEQWIHFLLTGENGKKMIFSALTVQGVSTTDEDDLTGIPLEHFGYIRLVLLIFYSEMNVG